jgi:hypothetical protein
MKSGIWNLESGIESVRLLVRCGAPLFCEYYPQNGRARSAELEQLGKILADLCQKLH